MGILNLTPDSFYDGGKLSSEKEILLQAEKMISEGATFLDLGGYSSRPGAKPISEAIEIKRVLPATVSILKEFPQAIISIDTFRSNVAKICVDVGASIINDISGGSLDTKMLDTVSELKAPYILMHMRGNPETMANFTDYKNLIKEILFYFSEKITIARSKGIIDIIADPGFGFAKTKEQNFELLNSLELFSHLNIPFLVGISRKSMLQKALQVNASESLNGTTALHSIALLKEASILRVHDVKEAIECVTLLENLKGNY
jgi:dihydropteroate synthase